jgi:hypothetical protein
MTQKSLANTEGIADIVFLIDISGSMQPCLDALKKNIGLLVDHMTNSGPDADAFVMDWRIKVCGYRDAMMDGQNWWQEHPFTSDLVQVRHDLATLEATGRGDGPTSLLDALWNLAKMPAGSCQGAEVDANTWRHFCDARRCVFAFTDNSCHMVKVSPEARGATFFDVAREVMVARLRLFLFCPEADCYYEVGCIDRSEIEVVGTLSDAAVKMSEFSQDTDKFIEIIESVSKGSIHRAEMNNCQCKHL